MGTLAAGIKEIFATAKTTGSNVMLCGNDGTPDGHMTMANLAIALGVSFKTSFDNRIGSESNVLNLSNGFYSVNNTDESYTSVGYPVNWPFDNENGNLLVFDITGYDKVILASNDFRRSKYELMVKTRIGASGWSEWKHVSLPSYLSSYSDLSSLANALGVTKRMEFVDLGLPSGTLWATRNLGAETPEDYGYYFSWGNVIGRKSNGTTFDYDWGTDNSGNYASTTGAALTGDIPTNMDYDAVQRYMGGSCKMPTKDQFVELFNSSYTTNEWITKNGVNGRLVTSKINGNSIFFPAAGFGSGTSLNNAGSGGFYWSRSLSSSANGYYLGFNSSSVLPQYDNDRFYGFSVRAVQ